VLARVFRELNLIEQWGSGVRRIFREALELGLPEPQFIELGLRVRVVVRLAQALPLAISKTTHTEQVTDQVTEQVTAQVMKLLGILLPGPMGTRAAMGELDLTHRPTFTRNYLQPALQVGLIEMTQPQSPNSPTQKYRLTPTGSALLDNQIK
jgi:predicted HTH transcriptional regulator